MPKRNPSMTYTEMVADADDRKGSRLYRAESSEFVDGQLQELVTMTTQELAQIADRREVIDLDDLPTLQQRTILYCRSCSDSSTIPTFSGLARSLGVSTEGLNDIMRRRPGSPSAEWLRIVHDAFADALANAALRNLTNSIVSIFSLKARSGWKDSLTIETPAANSGPLDVATDAERIAEKYCTLPED